MRERFIPRLKEADPRTLVDEAANGGGGNLDPFAIRAAMMSNEKPGGHGERSVAVGTIDMAGWDAVAKIEGKPLYRLRADRYRGGKADDRVWVYAAGGYYYPEGSLGASERDAELPRRQDEDRRRPARREPQAHRGGAGGGRRRAVPRRRRQRPLRSRHRARLRRGAEALRPVLVRGGRRPARLRPPGGAGGALRRAAGDRREPVLAPGRPQPDPLRRDAAGPRLGSSSTARCPTVSSSTCGRST